MDSRLKQANPQVYAKIAGALYLLIIIAGAFGEIFVRGTLYVAGDPAATAANITAAPALWRLGLALDILMHVCDVPVMLALYSLLKPVNRRLAQLAVLFNLVQTAVLAANKLNLLMPLLLLGNAAYLSAFEPQQLATLTQLFIRLHSFGFGVGLVFFGCVCLVQGYLIYRSSYFPRLLGLLMALAGLSYLVNSGALLLAPSVSAVIVPAILLPPFVGELSLALWLLVKGVDREQWRRAEAG